MKTSKTLNFTDDYERLHDLVDDLLDQLAEECFAHREAAENDLNGVGQINYRNVSEMNEIVGALHLAGRTAQAAVLRQMDI